LHPQQNGQKHIDVAEAVTRALGCPRRPELTRLGRPAGLFRLLAALGADDPEPVGRVLARFFHEHRSFPGGEQAISRWIVGRQRRR